MRKFVVLLFVFCMAINVYANGGDYSTHQPRNAHLLQPNGRALSGNISNGSNFYYEVRTTSFGTLIVETTGNTDTYLIAYDSFFNYKNEDDNSGSGNNAKIEFFVRPNETYYFNVTGINAGTSGAFNITAVIREIAIIELEYDSWFTSSINGGEIKLFRIFLGNDSFYSVQWNDRDKSHTGELPDAADVLVGIRREGSSSYLIDVSDNGHYTDNGAYSNEHRVYNSGYDHPRYETNTWYIIEVEAYDFGAGTFQIRVW